MFNIDQSYFNKIAAQGKLKYEMNQKLFSLPTEQMDELYDQYWMDFAKLMENKGLVSIDSETAASILMQLLPLYLENEAISNYIRDTNSLILWNALPEVLSPEEGLMILQDDYMGLDPDKYPILIDAIEDLKSTLVRTTYGKQFDIPQLKSVHQAPQMSTLPPNTIHNSDESGSNKKTVTKEEYEEAIIQIRAILNNMDKDNTEPISLEEYRGYENRMQELLRNSNDDNHTELIECGITLAEYHVKSGSVRFGQYAIMMIESLGEGILPYLKRIYKSVQYYPGIDKNIMDTHEDVTNFDLSTINTHKD